MNGIGLVLAMLALAAGVLYLQRLKATVDPPRLTDEMMRRIETDGWLAPDEEEPLDIEAIAEEEDRFWSESWDEPEEL
jgi:hypothetical protein